jgi:hypothetical protein
MPPQPFETSDTPSLPAGAAVASDTGRRLRPRAGLTPEQIGRLAALRARVRRGAYADDGAGTVFGSLLADRRLGFARWLVRTGRLHEGAG